MHVVALKAMLPLYPAGRGGIYSRYATFHVHHLESLPKDKLKRLEKDFSLRVNDGLFSAIHTDQFIETTYMLIGHGPSGTQRISIDQRQMEVWTLGCATSGEFVKNLMEMTHSETHRLSTHH